MAAPPSGHSTSRRTRDPTQGDVDIGPFRRGEDIGKGSFATVYKGVHKVNTSSYLSEHLK